MKHLAVFIGLMGASFAQAASLTSVGVLDATAPAPFSEVRAVSADGTYVVGRSTAWTLTSAANQTFDWRDTPFVWSAGSGMVKLPNPSGNHSIAYGVSVGIGSNTGNIIICGLHEGLLANRYYKAPLASLASGAWADSGAAGGLGNGDLRQGTSNNLRSDPLVGDGRWYLGGRRAANNRAGRLRGDPFIGWDGTAVRTVESVSGPGIVVGRDNASISNAYFEGPGQAFGTVPGAGGSRADGFGISASFGVSACANYGVQWICGQVNSYNGTNTTMQAFRWRRGDAAMTLLGSLAPAGGGDTGNNSSVAYTVSNNGVTAGRSFFGAADGNPSYEVATVWDTSGIWDNTGTPQSVKALLEADGVDTSEWTRLERVYAVSDDGRVLAGFGRWAADNTVRGFVAVATNPAPAPPPVVGACCVTDGPNAGTCSFVTAAECSNTPFGMYRGDYSCCTACPGACCAPNAPCSLELAAACTAPRVFRGPQTLCGGTICQGACCGGFKSCTQEESHVCAPTDFKGVGTLCAAQNCPCSSSTHVWADTDVDGDVDFDDFGHFQQCFAGADNEVRAGCECLNQVNDSTIDGSDFGAFLNCVTGASVQWTQLLTPTCVP